MLNRLLSNKKFVAAIIVVLLIVVGIVIVVLVQPASRKNGKQDSDIKTESGQSEDDAESDEKTDGEGLQIKDEIDGTVDSVDASGSWDEPKNDTTQNEGNQNSGNGNQNENNNNNNAEEGSDEEILVDDKEWGEIY